MLFVLSCYSLSLNAQQNKNQQPIKKCELSEVDYAVYSALLGGLGGPEHPEESWKGKEILINSITSAPSDTKFGWGGWGFRSASKAAPSNETMTDFENKKGDLCTLESKFGDSTTYRIVSGEEIEEYFKKTGDGWKGFYQKYPNSAGYWGFSHPGYNVAGNEAVLYVSHSCGWLCGTGHLYFLVKQDDKWVVKNRLMLWIS
jgi:hypothetical protein